MADRRPVEQPGTLIATELRVGGMTCAACSGRIERKLNRLDGVRAEVNLATETAYVQHPDAVTAEDLIAVVTGLGYTAVPASDPVSASGAAARAALLRLLVAAVLTVPLLVLSMVPAAQFPYWQWLALILAVPVVGWAGLPFHRIAWTNARHGAATMETLVSLGAVVSFGWGVWGLLFGGGGRPGLHMQMSWRPTVLHGHELYLEVGASLVTFLLVGRWFEARAKHRAGSSLRAITELGARDAARLDDDGREERVPVAVLRVGDRFVVRPGEKIATDGVVEAGAGAVDVSMLTGESIPVEVTAGDAVAGGTVDVDGRLVVRATRVGRDTRVAQLAALVTQAQTSKAEIQRVADHAAAVFVPFILVIAAATFAGWLTFAPAGTAFAVAVAVLVVACPCAMGLATPTALLVGTGRGAQLGLLIRGAHVLESTRRIDTVVLDKTGTLTTGDIRVVDVLPAPDVAREDLLRVAGAVEDAAGHPIARAISAAARHDTGEALPPVDGFRALPGLGVTGRVGGREVLVGRHRLLVEHGIDAGPPPRDGATEVFVAWDRVYRGRIRLADPVKPTSAEAVARLRALCLRPVMLTGDTDVVARQVGAAVGIDDTRDIHAGLLPEDKLRIVRELQAAGHVVAVAGDGVNDAAALAAADLGIAMGDGTDLAIQAGDLTVVRTASEVTDLRAAADAVGLARATLRTIRVNLFWAFAYNAAMIPLAALGLVAPVLAAAAMAGSSTLVVLNSLRLFRWTPPRTGASNGGAAGTRRLAALADTGPPRSAG